MFVNRALFNSEAWSSMSHKHIEKLKLKDRCVLRFNIGAHAKTASEALHLETGTFPLISHINKDDVIFSSDHEEAKLRAYAENL